MLKKVLTFYTRYFALWVVVFGLVAYRCPGPFVALREYNKLFFSLTMFGIGAVLRTGDFKRIAQKPWIVGIGTATQFLVMPFGGFVVARMFKLPPEVAAGLILTGSAPGAMASNVMCYIAGADTAYSVSLTTVSTLLCPVLTPGLTLLLAGSMVPVPFWKMLVDVLLMVIIPLFVGFALRHFCAKQVERIVHVFPAISATFIIFICSLVIALNRDRLAQAVGPILIAVVVLNIWGITAGYGVGSLFRMERIRRRTLAIEIGMQNAGLGTTLALAHLGSQAALPAAVFVFVCIITASTVAAFWQSRAAPGRPTV